MGHILVMESKREDEMRHGAKRGKYSLRAGILGKVLNSYIRGKFYRGACLSGEIS